MKNDVCNCFEKWHIIHLKVVSIGRTMPSRTIGTPQCDARLKNSLLRSKVLTSQTFGTLRMDASTSWETSKECLQLCEAKTTSKAPGRAIGNLVVRAPERTARTISRVCTLSACHCICHMLWHRTRECLRILCIRTTE